MNGGELELVRWLQRRLAGGSERVLLGVGDDMAIVRTGPATLITSDLLLDGVHFDTRVHALGLIGRKAVACSLSDCAAMAVQPLCGTLSVALPRIFTIADAKALLEGMVAAAEAFGCDLVGGDTTSWSHPLAIDVTILAREFEGLTAVRRSGARPGDLVCVTGPLGGSLRGRHLTFTPRVAEAHRLALALGSDLHAMMDLSDGLSLDLFRMCEASDVGAMIDELLVERVASADAIALGREDGRSAVQHALEDGEDFELLLAVGPDAAQRWFGARGDASGRQAAPALATTIDHVTVLPVGTIVERGYSLRRPDGAVETLTPRGYAHPLDGVAPDD